jgi:hypothetical protein
MSSTTTPTRHPPLRQGRRRGTLIGVTGVGAVLPLAANPAAAGVETPYNNCPGSPCIIRADIDTSGATVKVHGETRYLTQGSQWYLTVRRNGAVVTSYASDSLSTNRLDADLGVLRAGGAYELTVLAGPRRAISCSSSRSPPARRDATPRRRTCSSPSPCPSGSAQAYIRKSNGVIVASATSTGLRTPTR